ncbi:MAG: hypothetical protein MZW92_71360 [Comamonadaceae bacterium]|nr:hypothetical protein [Comamonadaceae bacterium]
MVNYMAAVGGSIAGTDRVAGHFPGYRMTQSYVYGGIGGLDPTAAGKVLPAMQM